ncbi:ClpP/crotonase [Calocera viscosa TUFC12733]|uniref:ClpP/crotonase n=1 Tax=Calocera viscosa (strain TUFC12733) TaxID=1330018 RepID=A0A167K7B3_CALVF|nr:ClpP/crotonase [Calocera viscosa TUFC12733]
MPPFCSAILLVTGRSVADMAFRTASGGARETDCWSPPQLGRKSRATTSGADIKEMKDIECTNWRPTLAYGNNFLSHWAQITEMKKPVIAAVRGYALGGGCELAMMRDIILASTLASSPRVGGTQRLAYAIGKSRAMEILLTGRNINTQGAEKWGLVVKEGIELAKTIASKGRLSVMAAKERVNASYDLGPHEGMHFERRLFKSLFATKNQKEGMLRSSPSGRPN